MEGNTEHDGVEVDIIGSDRLEGMSPGEKASSILDSVENGKIIILEQGLTSEEESRLIELTMSRIEPTDDFNGIEIESSQPSSSNPGLMGRLLGDSEKTPITFIGPANKIETLQKESDLISTLIIE